MQFNNNKRQKHNNNNNNTTPSPKQQLKQLNSRCILHVLSFIEIYIENELLLEIQTHRKFHRNVPVPPSVPERTTQFERVGSLSGTYQPNVVDTILDITSAKTRLVESQTVPRHRKSSLLSKFGKMFSYHPDVLSLHKLIIKHLYGRVKKGTEPVLLFKHVLVADQNQTITEARHQINHMNQPALSFDIQRQHCIQMLNEQRKSASSSSPRLKPFESVVSLISNRKSQENHHLHMNDLLFIQTLPVSLSSVTLVHTDMTDLLLHRFHSVTKLSLQQCFSFSSFKYLPHLMQLKELDLTGTSVTIDQLLVSIPFMTRLDTLILNDLSAEKFDSDGNALCDLHVLLSGHSTLRQLTFDNNEMSCYSATKLLLYPNISTLGFTRANVIFDFHDAIAEPPRSLPALEFTGISNLKELDLSDNWDALGSKHLIENVLFIARFPNITRLNLNRCNITSKAAKIFLGNSYPICKSLLYLDLSQNSIDHEGVSDIERNTNLLTLLLSYNRIGDEGCLHLARSKLQTLYLNKCQVTDRGAMALLTNRTMTRIHLRKNKLSDVTLLHLATIQNQITTEIPSPSSETQLYDTSVDGNDPSVYDSNTSMEQIVHTLQVLDVGYNLSITYHSTTHLPFHTGLTFLSMRGNQIGNRGTSVLFLIPNIVELDISDVKLLGQEEALKYIFQSRLQRLHVKRCGLGDNGARILLSSRVSWIDLSFNDLTDEFVSIFAKRKPSLEFLNVLNSNYITEAAKAEIRKNKLETPLLQLFI